MAPATIRMKKGGVGGQDGARIRRTVDIRFEGRFIFCFGCTYHGLGQNVIGAVILGYSMDNDWAAADRAQVQADVAYLASGEIRNSSSLDPAVRKNSIRP